MGVLWLSQLVWWIFAGFRRGVSIRCFFELRWSWLACSLDDNTWSLIGALDFIILVIKSTVSLCTCVIQRLIRVLCLCHNVSSSLRMLLDVSTHVYIAYHSMILVVRFHIFTKDVIMLVIPHFMVLIRRIVVRAAFIWRFLLYSITVWRIETWTTTFSSWIHLFSLSMIIVIVVRTCLISSLFVHI